MPIKRVSYRKKPMKKKTTVRRGRPRNQVAALPLSLSRNPRGMVKLKYATNLTLTTSTKVGSENVFRLNSLYDPDLTGAGHQPYMHDTLATMWKHYKVKACRIEVTFRNTSANSADNVCYIRGINETNNTIDSVQSSAFIESGQLLKYGRLKPLYTASGAISNPWTRLVANIDLKKYATTRNLDDADYSADFGANPTKPIYGIIGWCGESTSSLSVDCHVLITFSAEVSDPVRLAQS